MNRPLPSARDRLALHAAAIMPSAAVRELERDRRRQRAVEEWKAELVGSGADEADMKRALDELLDLPGFAEPISDVLIRIAPVEVWLMAILRLVASVVIR